MQRHRATIIISGLLFTCFLLFIVSYDNYSTAQKQEDVNIHAQVVASSVWTLFTPVTEQYLSLSVRNNDYQQIQISSLGDSELFTYRNELVGFEASLLKVGLVRVEKFAAPINYKGQQIGDLKVHAYNKNIYLYGYIFLLLLLTSLLLIFVSVIYQDRRSLRTRVAIKTAELAGNNKKLREEIAERTRSEKALFESEQTVHVLFENSFQFIALLDPQCRICKLNQTALNYRNLKEADLLGKLFWDTPWWSHSPRLVAQLKDAYAKALTGQIARFEAHSSEIREIYLDVSLKPVLDDDGQIIFIIAEAREITELKRAEQELQQAQKMESVGTLAGGIAHDFNNILGGILGTLALLKLKRDKGLPLSEDKLYGYLDTITETAMRAKDMVNQLLALSRKYDLKFAPLNLTDIFKSISQIASTSFDKSVSLDIQLAEKIPVYADANSLEQVFLNICINAAHAMTIMRPPSQSWGGTLSISHQQFTEKGQLGREAGDYWKITIADTGVGIDSGALEKVFVPFFTTKTKEAGSGLGLSMVYNIIKQHKGFIYVESEVGVGSRFHVFLPVSRAEQTETSPAAEDQLERGKGTILVVDDEELIRNSASEMLEECGYSVIKAENGEQAIELYQQHRDTISAVLLDLVMPVLSGKETYQALKQINPEVIVLLSSGFRHDARVDEILSAGAAGFIQKPYSFKDLTKTVKQLTDLKSAN